MSILLAASSITNVPTVSLTLAFSDEFATLSLDTALNASANWAWKWVAWDSNALDSNGDEAWKAHSTYNPGEPADTPAQMGVVLHEIVGSNLKLYARLNPDPTNYFGYGYLGGMISSELSHWQTYGTWECRARFKVTKGQHWAMWLIPKDGGWPPEIDMVECVADSGASLNRLFINEHGNPGSLTYFNSTVAQASLPAHVVMADTAEWQDWHIYKFVWTPSTMEWWIDGLKRMSTPNYVDKPMYFIISPEVSGSWPGDPDGTTVWPAEAEIEYVRIYEGADEPPPPSIPDFIETWAGTDGAAWNSTRWPVVSVTSTSIVDIDGNRGRMVPQGAAFARARAEAASGNFADFNLTVQFQMSGVAEQYHSLNTRHTSGWVGNNPSSAYQFIASNGNYEFRRFSGGTATSIVTGAQAWSTSLWNLRMLFVGSALKIKWWLSTEINEPAAWNIEVTNATHTAGIISLTSLNGSTTTARPIHWDSLSVTMA